jgi:hypothetical protein
LLVDTRIKRLKKMKAKIIFKNKHLFSAAFFYCFFLQQKLPNLKPSSRRPLGTNHWFENLGGVKGRLFVVFSLRSVTFGSFKIIVPEV